MKERLEVEALHGFWYECVKCSAKERLRYLLSYRSSQLPKKYLGNFAIKMEAPWRPSSGLCTKILCIPQAQISIQSCKPFISLVV